MLNETELAEIKCITLTGENVVITAAHFDALLSSVRELQRQVQEREADARRYRWLRENLHPDHFCAYMNYPPSEALLWRRDAIDAAIDDTMVKESKPHER